MEPVLWAEVAFPGVDGGWTAPPPFIPGTPRGQATHQGKPGAAPLREGNHESHRGSQALQSRPGPLPRTGGDETGSGEARRGAVLVGAQVAGVILPLVADPRRVHEASHLDVPEGGGSRPFSSCSISITKRPGSTSTPLRVSPCSTVSAVEGLIMRCLRGTRSGWRKRRHPVFRFLLFIFPGDHASRSATGASKIARNIASAFRNSRTLRAPLARSRRAGSRPSR